MQRALHVRLLSSIRFYLEVPIDPSDDLQRCIGAGQVLEASLYRGEVVLEPVGVVHEVFRYPASMPSVVRRSKRVF